MTLRCGRAEGIPGGFLPGIGGASFPGGDGAILPGGTGANLPGIWGAWLCGRLGKLGTDGAEGTGLDEEELLDEIPLAALPASAPVFTPPPLLFSLGMPPLSNPANAFPPPPIGTGGAPELGGPELPGTGGAPLLGGADEDELVSIIRPPVWGALRSTVTVFFNCRPLRISPNSASRPGAPLGGPGGLAVWLDKLPNEGGGGAGGGGPPNIAGGGGGGGGGGGPAMMIATGRSVQRVGVVGYFRRLSS